jgi:hypothetical protein
MFNRRSGSWRYAVKRYGKEAACAWDAYQEVEGAFRSLSNAGEALRSAEEQAEKDGYPILRLWTRDLAGATTDGLEGLLREIAGWLELHKGTFGSPLDLEETSLEKARRELREDGARLVLVRA